jgi:CRP/FNR family transcriptional regulator, cyclic AMP receptor protein
VQGVRLDHPPTGAILNEAKKSRDTDLDRLSRLKALAWLSTAELTLLVGALAIANFGRDEIIFREAALASEAHILLAGIARVTCLNARGERVTVAMLAPGPIPEFPSWPTSRFNFECVAYKDCRVGSLSHDEFDAIGMHASESVSRRLHENDLKQWYRLLLRGSGYLIPALRERVALALLELCSDFGVEESRGTLLRESFSHQDIAELVGASRPRVTEHLAQLEHDSFVVRQGRQIIVRVGELSEALAARAA